MTLSQFNRKLDKELNRKLGKFHFYKSEALIYKNEYSEGVFHELTFPSRCGKAAGAFSFNAHVCISFLELEKLLRPSHVDEGETIATVMVPIHFLHEDRIYKEWSCDNDSALGSVVEEVMRDLERYAFPFFKNFSNIDYIEYQLKSDSPQDWFILNPEQRLATLAAIAFAKGKREEAMELIRSRIAERKDALPKKRRLLEDLRNNLQAQQH